MRRLSAAQVKVGQDSAIGVRSARTLMRNALEILVDDDPEIVDRRIAAELGVANKGDSSETGFSAGLSAGDI